MKKIFTCIVGLFIAAYSFSQVERSENEDNDSIFNFRNDVIYFDIDYLQWLNIPLGVDIKPYSLGFGVYAMQNVFRNDARFNIAIGLGVSSQNMHINAQPSVDSNNIAIFNKIPSNVSYQRNKIVTTYLDVPVELRLKSKPNFKNKSFKFYAGARLGMLINNHSKYKGNDFYSSDNVKIKLFGIKNLLEYRYGITARIGYDIYNIIGYYSLSTWFKKNKGPDIIPYSVGFSISL